jgi:type IV pilus assembly protein PilQ
LDNKEAAIQQGDSIPFETVSDKGTQTQFIDATLNLTVTPHITPNGSVIMKIKATKTAIGDFRSRLGAPSISKREATTEVMVQDGETTVIGGIFENTKSESETGVPWLSKIPGLSWLFKRQSVSDQTRELLIFITPTIVKRT